MRSAPPLRATHPALILLVDDNRNGIIARSAVLRSLGYEVVTAGSAEEALELVAQHPVDLLVTDFRMPAMDGVELIQALRASNFEKPIILLTGFADRLGFTEAITGANMVIQKSANEVQILSRGVKRLLTPRKPPGAAGSGGAPKSSSGGK
jgi:CheY-like chemotaxis protein